VLYIFVCILRIAGVYSITDLPVYVYKNMLGACQQWHVEAKNDLCNSKKEN